MTRGRGGFTLMELIVAMGLASLVLVALNSLLLPLVRAQVASVRGGTAQAGLAGALGAAERALRGATLVTSPSIAGFPAERLEGCWNATPGERGPVPLDPSRPTAWFAVCAIDGSLFYHEGRGCPAVYECGRDARAQFGGGSAGGAATASFTRSTARSPVIDIELSVASGGVTARARSAVAVSLAAGSNQ